MDIVDNNNLLLVNEINKYKKSIKSLDVCTAYFNLRAITNIAETIECASDEFIKEAKSKLWIYQQPIPYHMYVQVFQEIYKKSENQERTKTPSKNITEACACH